MDVFKKLGSNAGLLAAYLLLPLTMAHATTFPGVTPPYTLGNTETLDVNSGTMATASGNATGFTIQLPTAPGAGNTSVINIASGATVSYAGSASLGTIYSSRNDTVANTSTITNNGTIDAGTGTNAIYINNSDLAAASVINLNNNGTINGNIFNNGPGFFLGLDGQPSINGTISIVSLGSLDMDIGANLPTTFTTGGNLSFSKSAGVGFIQVYGGSTLNLNYPINLTRIALTVLSNATVSINDSYTSSHGMTVSGTINISADISLNGTFPNLDIDATGIANVRQAVTVNIIGAGADYINLGTHNAVLTNIQNYGSMTLTSPTTTDLSNCDFGLVYEGGYFPGGTYTLLSSPDGLTTTGITYLAAPTATQFLTFSPAFLNGTTEISAILTRTPYQTFATNAITYEIATALEALGSNNPSASDLSLLATMEALTTPAQVQAALTQLIPIITAPQQTYQVQNQSMKQAELRLATVKSGYISGDKNCSYSMWIRGFGDKANQQAFETIQGYYASTGGFAIGYDRLVNNNFLVGIAGSIAMSHVTDKSNPQSITDINSYQAMLYSSYDFKFGSYLDLIADFAVNNFNGNRIITSPFNLVAQSEYLNQLFSVKATWGEVFAFTEYLQPNPEISLQYTYGKPFDYTETGAGAANMTINQASSNFLQGAIGGKLIKPIINCRSIWAPEIHAMVLYNIINGSQDTIATFGAGGTNINQNFTLPRSGARLGAALSYKWRDKIEFKVNYDFETRSGYTDNSFYVNFKYTF